MQVMTVLCLPLAGDEHLRKKTGNTGNEDASCTRRATEGPTFGSKRVLTMPLFTLENIPLY